MKRLVADNNEELYLKIKEFINTTMKSVTGKNLIQTKLIPAMLQANEEVSLKNAKQFMIDYEPFIAQRIKDIIDKYISENSLDDVSDDVYDTFNAHLLDGYTESEFNNIYNSVKEKSEECYKELLNKKDKIGDEVTTSSSYDDSNTRFVYLNGKLKIKQSNDHGELFDDIAKEQGYTNSYEYSQDPKNKNAIFCSGKIEDGVAIIETENEIKNINEIISALKKNGAKKVYTNDNKIGNETKFKRVAKRLIKSEVEINEETITSAIKKYFNEKPNMKKIILRMETYVYLNKKCLGGKLIIYPEKSEFDDFILEHGCKENTHLFSLGNRIARKLNIPYEQKKQIYQIIDKCFTNCYSEEDLKKFCYPVLDEYSVDCYQQLLNNHDKIGETVTTSNGYDSQNNRFIYLNGKYLEGNCQDHMELFEQLSQKIGYDNFQQFCEQNPDAQVVTGKVKNGVAIIETSSGKVDANANINDVISVLKKNGIKKIYTNTNMGNDSEFKRVAKRLVKY